MSFVSCKRRVAKGLVGATVAFLTGIRSPASAGTMTGAATEPTQVLNNVALLGELSEQIKQVVQLAEQIKMMRTAAADFKNAASWTNFARDAYGSVERTRGVLYGGQSLHAQWRKVHPGMGTSSGSDDTSRGVGVASGGVWTRGSVVPSEQKLVVDNRAYKALDDEIQDSVSDAFHVLDLDAEGASDDASNFKRLEEMANSADGQLKVAKVANKLLLELIRQQMKLHDLLVVQARLMGEQVSAAAQARQYDATLRQRSGYTGRWSARQPVDFSKR